MATVTALRADPMGSYRLSHEHVPASRRRLSDKVLVVFYHACDSGDIEAAEHLFRLLEVMAMRHPQGVGLDRRLNLDALVNAHERLLALRETETEREDEPPLPA